MSIFSYCPDCNQEVHHADSGEPDHVEGLRCSECGSFWSYDLYAEIMSDLLDEQNADVYDDDDGHDDPHYPY